MNASNQIQIFLSMLAMYLPTLIVCLVAGVIIFARWRQAAAGALWALLGFGLAFLLCIAMPLGHALLQSWVFQDGQRETRMWALSVFSGLGSILHALVYALLLVAIFAGRTKTDPTRPPPAN